MENKAGREDYISCKPALLNKTLHQSKLQHTGQFRTQFCFPHFFIRICSSRMRPAHFMAFFILKWRGKNNVSYLSVASVLISVVNICKIIINYNQTSNHKAADFHLWLFAGLRR